METLGCSGMTHSAAMAAEILPGKTLLECLNTDLVCDAINVAMREIFKQLVIRPQPDRFLRGRSAHRRQPGGPGQGPAFSGGHHVLHRAQGRSLHGDGRRLCHLRWLWTRTARSSATSLSRWARCWRTSATALLPMRPIRTTSASTAGSTALPSTSTPEKNNSPS